MLYVQDRNIPRQKNVYVNDMNIRHMAIKLEYDKGNKYLQSDVFTSDRFYMYRSLLSYRYRNTPAQIYEN